MMNSRNISGRTRSGVALLMALVALVLLTSTAVPLLVIAQSSSAARLGASDAQDARFMVQSLQPLLVSWSRGHANEANAPFFEEIYRAQLGDTSVTVRAIDLSGRLHVSALRTFAAGAVPESVRAVMRFDPEQNSARANQRGQRALRPLLEEFVDADARVSLFPGSSGTAALSTSVVEWVSAHGDPASRERVALNVNGAPIALLRAALRGRDPSDAAEALALRQRGERIPDDLANRLQASSDNASLKRIPLRSTSEAFGFLISVENGKRSSRYWLVAEPTTGSWACTERRRADS